MLLYNIGFLDIGLIDILDIMVVTVLIFLILKWMKGSSAVSIFIAILLLFVIKMVAAVLNMKLLTQIMGAVLDMGVIAIIIIFQPEIRHFLIKLGSDYRSLGRKHLINRILGMTPYTLSDEAINEITDACRLMSAQKTGALIVLANVSNLNEIVETGDAIDARIESRLIQNLFFKNSPLHDGALIIRNNRLVAARCTLPNTQKVNLPPEYGMRHKAAIGITEETDAVVVVVSEETGRISYVRAGEIQTMENAMALKVVLEKANIGHIEQ